MHFACVLNVLGNLLLVLGGVLLVPLAVALSIDSPQPLAAREVLGFGAAIGVAIGAGLTLRTVFKPDLAGLTNREGAAIVSFTWILFSFVGGLPYVITGATGWTDAFFETMSGFTTTGASILPVVEVLPAGLQLWRHQTQWLGGMGIVVLSVAILPILGVGGYRMFRAEAPGGSSFERNAPRIKETATFLWALYLSITVSQVLALYLGGMSLYDAICHAFTTMSTGGFSTSTRSVAGWSSPFIQWTIVGYMVLAGANFGIYQRLITGPRRGALRNPELLLYLAVLGLATAVHVALLFRQGVAPGEAEPTVRAAAFTVSSIATTTGYATADFDRWPDALRLILLLLMFIGGCAGSTAGGMKVFRLAILGKATANELRTSITPRAVLVVRLGDRPLDRETVVNTMSFFVAWMLVITVATTALALLGLDLLSAFSAAAASLGNVGPGLGSVGPTANFAHVPALGKWLLAACMLVGRLELFTTLVLLLPRTWTR